MDDLEVRSYAAKFYRRDVPGLLGGEVVVFARSVGSFADLSQRVCWRLGRGGLGSLLHPHGQATMGIRVTTDRARSEDTE